MLKSVRMQSVVGMTACTNKDFTISMAGYHEYRHCTNLGSGLVQISQRKCGTRVNLEAWSS